MSSIVNLATVELQQWDLIVAVILEAFEEDVANDYVRVDEFLQHEDSIT
jgi:hypothetical protein